MNSETPSSMPPDDDKDLSGLGRDLLGGSTPASGSNPKSGWQPPTVEELHAILPHYEVSRMLGRGGMGAVYMGRQISLDRPVAIKILSGALEEDDFGFKERFKNEARAMAKLSHPGIIAVHDFGETADGLLYIVMEYVDGTDVARMIAAEGRLHTEHAMAITAHVCDALAYAHARGIIHRDIKPANIMVGYDGVVKVADFGLAKVHAGEGQTLGLTMSGMAMGTMHFIAPEALEYGSTVDHRADLYAVGVMLFQMLTGKLPQGMFRMPSLQVPGMDPRYDGIIARAMYEDREQRYQSATELRADLDGILTQPVEKVEAEDSKPAAALPTMARPQRPGGRKKGGTGAKRPVQEKAKSRGWGVWAAVILLCGGGAAAWLYLGGEESIEAKPVEQVSSPTRIDRVESPAIPSSASTVVSLASAPAVTKDEPFVNSLGMKFVPVPGTTVLFCIHETRIQDYEAFAAETRQPWPKPQYTQAPTHPAVNIGWVDAQAFCGWLSNREGRTYRLPTDQEWSYAVGIGQEEKWTEETRPETVFRNGTDFPWGTEWPPPQDSGNYRDENEQRRKATSGDGDYIVGYHDGFSETAPVMSFRPNEFGLYDLSGNVFEWCEDWYNDKKEERVLRGGSWDVGVRDWLLSSKRNRNPPNNRGNDFGFRLVMEFPSSVPAPVSSTAANPPTPSLPLAGAVPSYVPHGTNESPFTNSLGMKFVPVPGTEVLFCIHETRYRDYATFAAESAGTNDAWKNQSAEGFTPVERPGDHPVFNVSWDDARAFCSWLSRKEGRTFRLPTDAEWSMAAGIGQNEKWEPGTTPKSVFKDETEFPWGTAWPPPKGAGNYADESRHSLARGDKPWLEGYDDTFPTTAPVMSFGPTKTGLYDLSGNLWEWVEDWSDETKAMKVTRGGSWENFDRAPILPSHRGLRPIGARNAFVGFRVVAEASQSVSETTSPSQPTPSTGEVPSNAPLATKEDPFVNSLGMKFVPVPGTEVLFCIHETRRQDYAAFATENPGMDGTWKNCLFQGVPCGAENDHPVVGVNWDDMNAFCLWLGKKDGRAYRLPTDEEWSFAVGVAGSEKRTAEMTPEALARSGPNLFPWGNEFPPKTQARVGNYGDSAWHEKFPTMDWLEGYSDGFPTTAPVMRFSPNQWGLYDLGGNVWEMVSDWWNSKQDFRTIRGASFHYNVQGLMKSSGREPRSSHSRGIAHGFRVVTESPDRMVSIPQLTKVPQSLVKPVPNPETAASSATKDSPFVNSLGMKFVPVPGTEVLMCIHETRRRDFFVYSTENPGVAGVLGDQTLDGFTVTDRPDDHPIVGLSWDDVHAFCDWLNRKEGQKYRLPTDREWSQAVGLGDLETWTADTVPSMLSRKVAEVWPWGNDWPPPAGAGNYSDSGRKAKAPRAGALYLEDLGDGFPTTAPVMSFPPNPIGIYDLGGNVWEWCEDWFDAAKAGRVLRGGCWTSGDKNELLSSHRHYFSANSRGSSTGFRLVIELPDTIAAGVTTAQAADSATPPLKEASSAPAIHQLPEILTRIANYQKARHTQLSELTAKYRAALVAAGEAATRSGVLDEVVATESAITAAASLAEVIEKNREATGVVPLPPLAPLSETASPRLKELRDIFVGEISKIESNLVTGLEKSLAAVQVPLVQAERYTEAKALDTYREEILKAFQTPAESPAPASAPPADAVSSEVRILQNAVVIKDVCAWPKLTLMPDGSIIAIIFNQPHKATEEGDLACYASRDGLKWEKRGNVTRHEPDTVRMNHAAGLATNGDLLVLCGGWTNLKQPQRPKQVPFRDAELRPWIMRSSDGGRTWSKSETFPSTDSDEWSEHIPFGSIRAAKDGTLRVSTNQGQYVDPATSTRTKGSRAWCFRSNDDGLSWEPQAIISELHNEVDLFPLGGKSWLAAARTTNLDLIRSDDDGATWSAPVPVTARGEINGHLTRLADGRLLLSYGVRVRGSEGVSAKLSSDEGKTWSPAVRLADGLANDSGYPSSVQLKDGKIVTAYYSQKAPEYDGYHMGVTVWEAATPSAASVSPKP